MFRELKKKKTYGALFVTILSQIYGSEIYGCREF